jgi:hypothetical protein
MPYAEVACRFDTDCGHFAGGLEFLDVEKKSSQSGRRFTTSGQRHLVPAQAKHVFGSLGHPSGQRHHRAFGVGRLSQQF